jgi:D-alanyl-D-alanine carboxypeptidase
MTRLGSYLGSMVAGATVLALATAPTVPRASAAPHHPTPRTQVQRHLDAVVAAGATGATAQVDDGRHRTRASSGVAELGSSRPVPVNARFRAGSVTKTFIGTVILQLVAEHSLGLEDKVDDRLPGVLPTGTGITVRELLNHTSGLRDVLTTFPRPGTPAFLDLRWQTWSPEQLIARVANQPLLFSPGDEASYSNTNYMLLALIIERITAKPYATAIEQRIIRPLGLQDTSFPGTDPFIHGPHAHAYMPIQQGDGSTSIVDVTAFNPTIMWGGGEIISSTRDLNRFYDVLLGGELLPPDLMRQMHETAKGSSYGLGIIRHELSCRITAWGKDGDAPGYSTWSFSTPDNRKRVTVSVTGGTGDPDAAVDALLNAELCP